MRDHMWSWEIHLHTPLPRTNTYHPPHNPTSPESLQTGDILCCIWFEIISYNRWVFFPQPASQPHTAPRALVAAKIRKLPTPGVWSNSHRSAHQWCSHHTRHSTGTGFFTEIPVGVFVSLPLLFQAEVLMHVCVLWMWWSVKLRVWYVCGAAATGRQQSGCTL